MILITNGEIVLEDRIISGHSLVVEDDKIKAILADSEAQHGDYEQVINAYGGYITPGFIDIHADYIEHMVAPRPTSVMDMKLAVYEFEKECCTHGITTMYHSISLLDGIGAKPMRYPENVKKLADIIDESHRELHLIHHRFHMRFEIDNFNQLPLLLEYIKAKKVHLISFMDHTPGQGQYRNIELYKKCYLRNQSKLSEDDMDSLIVQQMKQEKIAVAKLEEIALLANASGIAIASHDDDTVEKLDVMKGLQASISEFPITLEVAHEAKKRGMYTVVGAPNILLGGSHSGNLSAQVAIQEGCADILCSDYYPASLLHAIFIMVDQGERIESMVAKLTVHPARAVKIDHITGSIEVGKKADILIIRKLPNGLPAITDVFVDGICIAQNHYRM